MAEWQRQKSECRYFGAVRTLYREKGAARFGGWGFGVLGDSGPNERQECMQFSV